VLEGERYVMGEDNVGRGSVMLREILRHMLIYYVLCS
jgi:hypothetical protein